MNRVSDLGGTIQPIFEQMIDVFISELQEQLMIDIRPELQQMIAAQNEVSDDLDAIRQHLQTISENLDGTSAEKLEDIVNALGLLVALL
jgi:hypothetical protein